MIIYYLEMTSKDNLLPKEAVAGISINEAKVKNFRFNRFLYQLVGEAWSWTDKLSLTDQAWQEYAENDNLRTWVAYVEGSIAGYYELQVQDEGNVELVYFGLAPDFIGKGLGGYLLTHAIATAWSLPGTRRVWVHTCDLDHPNALKNYEARGFTLYDVEHS
ncbi:GNAT family N-acetyltransferase [Pseudomaricurvus sp. HS19]|uniref:GNAT family N-acetyltransferase n=1 Tax=Pseudomaricurvus sp. HS19 TaxID=2692626 RepID=UPI001928BE3E|nr:GNAT family N-acetyltransferase [Pseudomaricurvus sp. HS19]